MGNPYPADVADSGGNVRLSGAITFTDADNQPGGGTQAVQAVTVTLNNAAIIALPTTEDGPFPGTVEVLPEVAATEAVGLVAGYLVAYNTSSAWAPYAGGADTAIFSFTDLEGNPLSATVFASTILEQLTPRQATLPADTANNGVLRTSGLLLLADVAGPDPWEGGHADNKLAVTVLYTVISLAT